MAYCNERIYIEDSAHSESFRRQGEPEPTAVPDLKEVLKAYDIQKIVFAGEDEYLRVRGPPTIFCLGKVCAEKRQGCM